MNIFKFLEKDEKLIPAGLMIMSLVPLYLLALLSHTHFPDRVSAAVEEVLNLFK